MLLVVAGVGLQQRLDLLVEALRALIKSRAAEASDVPDLPMGVWLGFHDGDTPLMAKLAVHDKDRDLYTFVNRTGIKMRELSGRELFQLMASEMVDILETRSNFRDAIVREKNKREE